MRMKVDPVAEGLDDDDYPRNERLSCQRLKVDGEGLDSRRLSSPKRRRRYLKKIRSVLEMVNTTWRCGMFVSPSQ